MAASHHGDTPYSGNSVTSVPVTPYTTSVDLNRRPMRKRLESATEKQKRKWLENFKPMLSRFYGRYGLYPAGSETLEHINDLLHEVPEIVTRGE